MNRFTLAIILTLSMLILCYYQMEASVISCPPNNLQEASPSLRQLCYAIEQVISDNSIPLSDQYGRLDDRNPNLNAKRQDVDHVFLRFGRRPGL